MGLLICGSYILADIRGYSRNFAVTLVILPAIIGVIIYVAGTNIASALSLAGAFSLIRFRSAPGNPKDLSYVFLAMAVGLATGMGYLGYAVLFTVVICAVLLILTKTPLGREDVKSKQLKIFVPEDLNFESAFSDILELYTRSSRLEKIKTADLGTIYELIYRIEMKSDCSERDMIDALRCRNGNLNIILSMTPEASSGFGM